MCHILGRECDIEVVELVIACVGHLVFLVFFPSLVSSSLSFLELSACSVLSFSSDCSVWIFREEEKEEKKSRIVYEVEEHLTPTHDVVGKRTLSLGPAASPPFRFEPRLGGVVGNSEHP